MRLKESIQKDKQKRELINKIVSFGKKHGRHSGTADFDNWYWLQYTINLERKTIPWLKKQVKLNNLVEKL